MEMPTLCQRCGEWFDLNDGYGSKKWYPGIIICESCHHIEEKEIELEEDIEETEELIEDAKHTIRYYTPALEKMKQKLKELHQ